MPAWLTDLLDDDHPDLPWRVPAKLPTVGDLRSAIAKCDAITGGGVTPAFAKECFAKLILAFEPNTKLSGDETRLRMSVWAEACGDLNDGLWHEATLEAIRSLKWMPKPAEFRALVDGRREAARRHKARLEAMLKAHERPEKPYVPETQEERLRSRIWLGWKHNRMPMAQDAERELATREKREPAAWATAEVPPPAPEPKPQTPKPLPSSPGMQIGLKTALAAKHRALGNDAYASKLEWEVADLRVKHGYPLPTIDKSDKSYLRDDGP